ncbi:type I polyketide synthase [Crenalkalicoccus roseus]|uniref:type I polyketide synthase n=1 Tax=Crenalkalicoccus roseus TaxID=1485588 RepID=UPI001080FCF6|nr:type I polyketide synthase [Crenalkalicoccus roseus]
MIPPPPPRRQGGAIAILGAACRLPGAPDPDAFWRLLAEGRDAVTTVPADRFTQARFAHPRRGEPGKSYSFAAGTLGDVAGFDPGAFGISPREAAEMDPQQRLLLEAAAEALEDAGWPPSALAGSGTGVFVGASLTDYGDLRQADAASGDRWFMTGSALSILANRIGNVFDLRGPAQTVDTACSSALVALHWACEALRAGRLPAALVGGVNLLLSPFPFIGFARAGMLSPRGRCHAFDARADGYVRAEGAVVMVLKRLEDALADGDEIRAVILGTAANAAGRTVGLSLPSQAAQQALIERALAEAGVTPDRLAYFEAHGTGTAAGDPIEAGAIGAAIGRRRREAPLPIGSAKTNIGHTEPASGLVGLLKAMLVLEHGRIPPSLHFETPNPAIDFAGLGLRVPVAAEALPRRGRAVIGVNSFGFGGTNACALLGPAPRQPRPDTAPEAGPPPLLLSAPSAEALRALAGRWRERLAETPAPALPALLRGAARHRDLRPHRLALRGGDPQALAAALAAWEGGKAEAAIAGEAPRGGEGIAFVFSGNGAQWPGMARAAFAASPAFRAAVAEADAALAPLLGWSVAERLAEGVTAEALAATDCAQPLLFAVQHGIVAALAAQGIRPALCLGHSVGEVAAALAAGLLGLPEAARLIVARSRHQHRTRGEGRMAALGAPEAEAPPVLAACGPGLEIAAINGPAALTIAGPEAALRRLAEAAEARGWSFVPLDLDYAFHSAAMDPVRAGLLAELGGLAGGPPRLPFLSSVTGEALEACDAAYWWRNLREPVRFRAAVEAAAARRPALFLEIGPHPALQSYLRESLRAAGSEAAILPTLSRRDGEGDPFPGIADRAFVRGADPRGGPAFAGPAERRAVPRTPFARRRIWYAPTPEATPLAAPRHDHPLLGCREGAEPGVWTRHLDTAQEPWLADHRLAGEPVLPAAAMLEMALAAAALRHPEAPALEVAEFAVPHALPLEEGVTRELRCELDESGRFTLRSRRRLSDEPWTLHAEGRAGPLPRLPPAAPPPSGGSRMDGAALRALAAGAGLGYGPAFAAVASVALDPAAGTARAALDLPEAAPPDAGFLLHPARLDGALQGLVGLLAEEAAEPGTGLVPVRFARLALRRDAAPATGAAIRIAARGTRSVAADLVLHDAAGAPVAVLEGAWLQRLRLPGRAAPEADAFRFDLLPALPGPAAEPPETVPLAPAVEAARARDAELGLPEPAMLLEGYCAAAAHAALAAAPATGRYARALLEELAADGLAAPGPAGLRPVPAPDLPPAGEIWRQVLLEQPDLAPELAWLARAAERLPEALAGAAPDPAEPALPAAMAGFDRLGGVLAAALTVFAAGWPRARPLRVLEIGAGTGGLTARAVAALAGPGRRILYCAASLPEGAAAAPPPEAPGVEVSHALWDPLGAEPPPVAADLVIGLGAGLRLRAGASLPAALRRAAAPGGALLLAEPLPGRLWDFACGQDPAWWSAPGGASPLPGAESWAALLAAEGWQEGAVTPLAAAPWPAVLLAARAPAGAAVLPAPLPRRVVLLADAAMAPLRGPLAAALQARGATVAVEDLAAAPPPPRALHNALVVALAGGGATPEALAATLAALARLAAAAEGNAAGFRLVTRGGQQPEGGRHDPAAAAVFALGRVLANEHPGLKPRRLDLCPALAPEAAARRLAVELLHEADGEAEVTLTAEARLVPRLRPGLPPAPRPPGPLRLAIRQPGQLATLSWERMAPRLPGPGEVALRVEAAGINFRDLMWAQGLLPEETLLPGFTGPGLGMECAGVVEAVGEGVPFRPGERVFGIAPSALATHAVTRAEALAPLPPGLDPAAAATVPVAFLTAVHALEELARVEAGERVLIHGGAGAVGLAALQVALARGAVVAATAGTPARRAFLRAAGAALVLDSRDPGFADALRGAWAEGVDVVLNSLSGEAMERSLGLLRPFGRFVELGKRDFAENRRVALRPLRRNATWFAVDVDELPRARPALAARLMAGIAARLAAGTLRPLPATVHAAEEAEGAFRALQASRRIGKLVLRPPAAAAGAAPARGDALRQAARGTVVVVGGAQGFGLATARFLAAQGVRHLALLSRRGPDTPGAEAALRDLAARGAAACLLACDAADEAALAATLRAIRATMPPIRGVVHAAAVFADGAAAALDPARAAPVLAAKLRAAEILDRLTAADPLALFLLFSSATVAVGNPGQAAYVAANAALEALARRRRAEGRPALAVQWGPIADAGVLAREARTAETLRRRLGAQPVPAEAALAALPALLAAGTACAGVARIAWGEAGAALSVLAEPAFEAVREAAALPGEADLRALLRGAPEEVALGLLREALAAELGRILRLPAAAVAPDATLAGLGLDSLGGMELRTALEQRLGMPVPLSAVTETLTVEALARRIAAAAREARAEESVAALIAAHEPPPEAPAAVEAAA